MQTWCATLEKGPHAIANSEGVNQHSLFVNIYYSIHWFCKLTMKALISLRCLDKGPFRALRILWRDLAKPSLWFRPFLCSWFPKGNLLDSYCSNVETYIVSVKMFKYLGYKRYIYLQYLSNRFDRISNYIFPYWFDRLFHGVHNTTLKRKFNFNPSPAEPGYVLSLQTV